MNSRVSMEAGSPLERQFQTWRDGATKLLAGSATQSQNLFAFSSDEKDTFLWIFQLDDEQLTNECIKANAGVLLEQQQATMASFFATTNSNNWPLLLSLSIKYRIWAFNPDSKHFQWVCPVLCLRSQHLSMLLKIDLGCIRENDIKSFRKSIFLNRKLYQVSKSAQNSLIHASEPFESIAISSTLQVEESQDSVSPESFPISPSGMQDLQSNQKCIVSQVVSGKHFKLAKKSLFRVYSRKENGYSMPPLISLKPSVRLSRLLAASYPKKKTTIPVRRFYYFPRSRYDENSGLHLASRVVKSKASELDLDLKKRSERSVAKSPALKEEELVYSLDKDVQYDSSDSSSVDTELDSILSVHGFDNLYLSFILLNSMDVYLFKELYKLPLSPELLGFEVFQRFIDTHPQSIDAIKFEKTLQLWSSVDEAVCKAFNLNNEISLFQDSSLCESSESSNLVCDNNVFTTALQSKPSIIAGFDGDLRKLHWQSMKYWEKVSLEPYHEQVSVNYFLLPPIGQNISALKNINSFMRNLGAMYDTCLLGKRHTFHPSLSTLQIPGIFTIDTRKVQDTNEYYDLIFEKLNDFLTDFFHHHTMETENSDDGSSERARIVFYVVVTDDFDYLHSMPWLIPKFYKIQKLINKFDEKSDYSPTSGSHNPCIQFIPMSMIQMHSAPSPFQNSLSIFRHFAFLIYWKLFTFASELDKDRNEICISSYQPVYSLSDDLHFSFPRTTANDLEKAHHRIYVCYRFIRLETATKFEGGIETDQCIVCTAVDSRGEFRRSAIVPFTSCGDDFSSLISRMWKCCITPIMGHWVDKTDDLVLQIIVSKLGEKVTLLEKNAWFYVLTQVECNIAFKSYSSKCHMSTDLYLPHVSVDDHGLASDVHAISALFLTDSLDYTELHNFWLFSSEATSDTYPFVGSDLFLPSESKQNVPSCICAGDYVPLDEDLRPLMSASVHSPTTISEDGAISNSDSSFSFRLYDVFYEESLDKDITQDCSSPTSPDLQNQEEDPIKDSVLLIAEELSHLGYLNLEWEVMQTCRFPIHFTLTDRIAKTMQILSRSLS